MLWQGCLFESIDTASGTANGTTIYWHLQWHYQYVCFLSHYKLEAGAEARYVKDSIDLMLDCPAYLDSSTLADLRDLFEGGVHTSEVLVLLLSEGFLTRPWSVRAAARSTC